MTVIPRFVLPFSGVSRGRLGDGRNEGGRFKKDGRFERGITNVFRVLRDPLLVTLHEARFKLAEVVEGFLTVQNQIPSLVCGQKSMIVPVGRHPLQDDSCSPGKLNKASLVIPILRILFTGLSCEFRSAQPMFEALVGIPKVLARLFGELSNCRRSSLPLYAGIPDLPPLSIGIRVSPPISVRTGLTGGVGFFGTGTSDLDGTGETMVVWWIWLVLVLWLWWLVVGL